MLNNNNGNINLELVVPTTNENEMLIMLRKLEGGRLHYNKGEKDITNGYGIYRYAHPHAEIWKYIDSIARSLGINIPSYQWSQDMVAAVNKNIDPEIEAKLSLVFYREYFRPTKMELYPASFVKCLVSIYVNGVKLYNKSLQLTLNKMIRAGRLPGPLLTVDGAVGNKTLGVVQIITNKPELHEEFKQVFLDTCKESYTSLANSNPAKYGRFLKGWHNRVEALRA